jgi:hypothetical protein
MNKFIFLIFYFVSLSTFAAVSVEVIETYPGKAVQVLDVDQNFYVHLKYSSDTPVRVYVRPFTAGKDTHAISHGALMLPPGAGETLGWFALRAPGIVDEYQISVDTTNSGYPAKLFSIPVSLEWKHGGVITDTGQPEWVGRINQINEALGKAERANAELNSSGYNMILGMLIMPLLFGIPLLAFALCVVAFIRWTGPWRYAGGLPLFFFGVWAVNLTIAVTQDPTSHNLWPFEMLYWAGGTLLWLVILFIVRKLLLKPEKS